jgi:hypothetical protein
MKFTSAVVAISAAALVAAAPASNGGHCNTGPVQCCNSVQKAGDKGATAALGLLNIIVEDVNAMVGFNCSPITAIGLGSSGCAATPVCCENNKFNGLVNVGCVPITVGL